MEDYIERAISRVNIYLPPNPEDIDHQLQNGTATLGQSDGGKSVVRFERYYEIGDSLVFIYDAATKALLQISIVSTLGSPKDPITMEALFERLPDGVNHL